MWQPSGASQTKQSSIYRHEIHVLLVDHDQDYLIYMVDLLESCSYKVTAVESGRVALSILTKGKHEFDLLLADSNLPDLDVIKLLRVAVHLELPSILMSEEYDKLVAEMAINNGAILLLQKPFTMETARNFWQYVMKERMPRINTLVAQEIITEIIEENQRYIPSNIELVAVEKGNETDSGGNNGFVPKKTQRSKKSSKKDEEIHSPENYSRPSRVKRKVCTEWTEELHARFVNAVNHLGDGRCYPKEILDLMNVPGLTRMQVASHLQKCRNDDWRAPHTRRTSHSHALGAAPTMSIHKINTLNPRKFGAMPRLAKQHIDDILGKEISAVRHKKVKSFASTSVVENQSTEHELQVTCPISVPSLPPAFENLSPLPVLIPNLAMQTNIDGPFGGYDFLDSTIPPTIDITSSEFGIDATGLITQEEFQTAVDNTYQQSYDYPAFSDVNVDFLPDLMDGLVNNINGLPEGSSTTYPSSRYQQFVDDFNHVFTDQSSMATNRDGSVPWSLENTNFFG